MQYLSLVKLLLPLLCNTFHAGNPTLMQFWLGPAIGFTGLIAWSLDHSSDLKEQLYPLLTNIIERLRLLPFEDLSEVHI